MMKFWLEIMRNKYFIFDLDDTLVSEIDYLKSAYRNISKKFDGGEILYNQMLEKYYNKEDVFLWLSEEYGVAKNELLLIYRFGMPELTLKDGASNILNRIKNENFLLGLITDGRSVTQRNKLKALGLEDNFEKIIISEEFGTEKPNPENFKTFHREDISEYFYIADNTQKDFIAPNILGWTTICLKNDGQNIHKQDFSVSKEYLPKYQITHLNELEKFI